MRNLMLRKLFEKFLREEMSQDEIRLLQNYVLDESNRGLLDELLESAYTNHALSTNGDYNLDEVFEEVIIKARLANTTIAAIESMPEPSIPVRHMHFFQRQRWWAAAAILLIVAASAYFWLNTTPPQIAATNSRKQLNNDVAPGGNKAILTLADGTKIVLDSAANGMLTQQGNSQIVKLADGQLAYTRTGTGINETILYNTMSIPRGGQYKLTLPDGSQVWLNAGSSITYPTAFTGKERIVSITGEAYFEVTKNAAMPFQVDVNGMKVEVLGTHFDVMAYENESAMKTTLLEGSVKVWKDNAGSLLKPGQQAALSKSLNMIKVIDDVDVDMAVAWKNGYTSFTSVDMKSIMRQVERWYDIDVAFEGDIPERTFTGEVSRSANLSELLRILEASKIHFSIEGRKMIVRP